MYSIDEKYGKVYAYTENSDGSGNPAVVAYDLKSLDELISWAEEVIRP